jgi:hypothetical protein
VTAAVLRVLRGDDDPKVINDTIIVLISKVENPEDLGQFWPISLCDIQDHVQSCSE